MDGIVENRLREEVRRGVQTIQYQVVTLLTTNGQAPFVTVFMYLNEAKNEREKKDLAMIIEETLRQRYQGVKNESGSTPQLPHSPSLFMCLRTITLTKAPSIII